MKLGLDTMAKRYASGMESSPCLAGGLIRYDSQWGFMSHGEALQMALEKYPKVTLILRVDSLMLFTVL